ncbi:ribonuclease E/G family protein [Asticcacaulis biprosthecium C19]|uniref:Ribonuclease E/G family protein n=1 Tax=Asticcacaulis biprosthecium C19 TaxID=715226 RepID=F4QRZ7_9CAUL|nr:ribonuclease E/G [Asticcacaulis biprosthecium]EGF89517.1 ribonuclease E/G family protein [Asticcacaulis biprosthecium C19]
MLTLHYEARFGLARGAIYGQGRPQLFAQGYEHDHSLGVLGTQSVARLRGRAGSLLFLKLADGSEAVLEGPNEVLTRLNEGVAMEVEVVAEARGDKLARARYVAAATGDPRRLSPVQSLKARLLERARSLIGDLPVMEAFDREAIDTAEEAARQPSGDLPGGGYLHIEPTRALVACDVDTSGATETGMASSHTAGRACNEAAVRDIGRRLRLSALAGLIVVDLIGKRHDGDRLRTLLLQGFGAEAPRLAVAPIGKFGTLEFTRPWGTCPTRDTCHLLDAALYSLWQAIRLSEQDRSRVIIIRQAEPVISILRPRISASLDPLAPMLRLEVATPSEVIFL